MGKYFPLIRRSSCSVKRGILSPQNHLPIYWDLSFEVGLCPSPWGVVPSGAVFCPVSLRCVLCSVCVPPWCVCVCCCSPLCFVLCVSWGVALCVPRLVCAVRCCAALCWCTCVLLVLWSVLFLAPAAVVRCCVLCSLFWCSAARCCAALLAAWCAVLLRAVLCSLAPCRVLPRYRLCGAVLCCAGAPACSPLCYPLVLPVVYVCLSPGLIARCSLLAAPCGVCVPGWSGLRPVVGCGLSWCHVPLRSVLWCCASVCCCPVVPCGPFLCAVFICLLWRGSKTAAKPCFKRFFSFLLPCGKETKESSTH